MIHSSQLALAQPVMYASASVQFNCYNFCYKKLKKEIKSYIRIFDTDTEPSAEGNRVCGLCP